MSKSKTKLTLSLMEMSVVSPPNQRPPTGSIPMGNRPPTGYITPVDRPHKKKCKRAKPFCKEMGSPSSYFDPPENISPSQKILVDALINQINKKSLNKELKKYINQLLSMSRDSIEKLNDAEWIDPVMSSPENSIEADIIKLCELSGEYAENVNNLIDLIEQIEPQLQTSPQYLTPSPGYRVPRDVLISPPSRIPRPVPSPSPVSDPTTRMPPSGITPRGPSLTGSHPSRGPSPSGRPPSRPPSPSGRPPYLHDITVRHPSPFPSRGPSPSGRPPSRGPSLTGSHPSRGPSPSGRPPSRGPSPSVSHPSRGPSPSGRPPSRGPSPSGSHPSRGPSPSGRPPSRGPSPSGRPPSGGPSLFGNLRTGGPGSPYLLLGRPPSRGPSPSGRPPSRGPSPSGSHPSRGPSPSGRPPSRGPSPSGIPPYHHSLAGIHPSPFPSRGPSPSGRPPSRGPSPSGRPPYLHSLSGSHPSPMPPIEKKARQITPIPQAKVVGPPPGSNVSRIPISPRYQQQGIQTPLGLSANLLTFPEDLPPQTPMVPRGQQPVTQGYAPAVSPVTESPEFRRASGSPQSFSGPQDTGFNNGFDLQTYPDVANQQFTGELASQPFDDFANQQFTGELASQPFTDDFANQEFDDDFNWDNANQLLEESAPSSGDVTYPSDFPSPTDVYGPGFDWDAANLTDPAWPRSFPGQELGGTSLSDTLDIKIESSFDTNAIQHPLNVEKINEIRAKLSRICNDQYREVIELLQKDQARDLDQYDNLLKRVRSDPFQDPDATLAPIEYGGSGSRSTSPIGEQSSRIDNTEAMKILSNSIREQTQPRDDISSPQINFEEVD